MDLHRRIDGAHEMREGAEKEGRGRSGQDDGEAGSATASHGEAGQLLSSGDAVEAAAAMGERLDLGEC
ncbi:unnamed protein product [Urochloa humidicola]